jgi:hypothetical protein
LTSQYAKIAFFCERRKYIAKDDTSSSNVKKGAEATVADVPDQVSMALFAGLKSYN